VRAGRVLVGGAVVERPARLVSSADPVVVDAPPARFVGRGGLKLDAALDRFGLQVVGRRALDAGASTGGFTDCLVQRGVALVVAVDVGRGQLHPRLRSDPRVCCLERTNIRTATLDQLGGERFGLTVADLSFISLRSVAPTLVSVTEVGGDLVVLVKPQFECGRAAATRGRGVIRDPGQWRGAVAAVVSALRDQGAVMMGVMPSPLTGADGNVEFLAHLRRVDARALDAAPREAAMDAEIDAAVDTALERVSGA
jgi:23S rRNA (cytidine1920-2'-O)/16S rRNA (cytidine1409-2'-O)-methyltransferase